MKASKELKIGIFAVIVLTMTFFIINFLRGKDIFGREMELKAYYGNAEGLLPSAPVYIKGYKAGSVTAVEYMPESGDFCVVCSVQKRFTLPEDSEMVIYGVDIMGGKGVRIEPGASSVPAANGAVLHGRYEADLMSSLSGSIGPLLEKVTGAVDSISIAVSGVKKLLDGADPQSISRTLGHLENTMANAERLSGSISGRSDELTALIDNLAAVSGKLSGVIEHVDSAVVSLGGVAESLDNSDIEGLVASFRSLLDNLQDPDGSIGKLVTDDSVYLSIDSLLSDIDSLVKKIEENPKKYIKISIF